MTQRCRRVVALALPLALLCASLPLLIAGRPLVDDIADSATDSAAITTTTARVSSDGGGGGAGGGGGLLPVYPRGDCPTECSGRAHRLTACPGLTCAPAAAAAPSPAAAARSPADDDDNDAWRRRRQQPCPTLRFPDAISGFEEFYCMPTFRRDCSQPDNAGCLRCVLWRIVDQHCVRDAYDDRTGQFNASCGPCNDCEHRTFSVDGGGGGGGSGSVASSRSIEYALLRARGERGGLTRNHWLALPRAPCVGVESPAPGCTDAAGELLWAAAWREATGPRLRFPAREASWALMINAPNRRGQHQLHIHIAALDTAREPPPGAAPRERWLLRALLSRAPTAAPLSTDPSAPTVVLGEGRYNPAAFACAPLGRPPRDWARAFAVFVPAAAATGGGGGGFAGAADDPGRDLLAGRVRPYALARQLAAASDLPSHGYGIVVAPHASFNSSVAAAATPGQQQQQQQDGLIVAVVWSTDDVEQLDVEELPGDPIGFSRTCANFAAAGGNVAAGRKEEEEEEEQAAGGGGTMRSVQQGARPPAA